MSNVLSKLLLYLLNIFIQSSVNFPVKIGLITQFFVYQNGSTLKMISTHAQFCYWSGKLQMKIKWNSKWKLKPSPCHDLINYSLFLVSCW